MSRHDAWPLVASSEHPYLVTMRQILPVLLLAAMPALAAAAPAAPAPVPDKVVPKLVAKFADWRTATHTEAGQIVCYAYTAATASVPPANGRGQISLTVTQRPGGPRDAVAVTPGFVYPPNSAVTASVDGAALEFYTAQRSAFARDGQAAVRAFLKGRQVQVLSPNPKTGGKTAQVADSFSLKGFSAAYAAINKACPPK